MQPWQRSRGGRDRPCGRQCRERIGPQGRAGAPFFPGQEAALILADDSPALRLIQRVRDEAHRFAITGHRQSRDRSRRESWLEEIPGLGPSAAGNC